LAEERRLSELFDPVTGGLIFNATPLGGVEALRQLERLREPPWAPKPDPDVVMSTVEKLAWLERHKRKGVGAG
jgi:hypothetical protein